MPDEWRQNISQASIGKAGTNTGRKFSEEHKLKMSQSLSGKQNLVRRKFTHETELEICSSYTDGLSIRQISKKFDLGNTLVRDILIRNNISRRTYGEKTDIANKSRRKLSSEKELELCSLYLSSKYSVSDLSRIFNMSKTGVRDVLVRNNVKNK